MTMPKGWTWNPEALAMERMEFVRWLTSTYGSEVAQDYLNNQSALGFPPKRRSNLGKIIGRGVRYDFTKLYNTWKNPAVEGEVVSETPAEPTTPTTPTTSTTPSSIELVKIKSKEDQVK